MWMSICLDYVTIKRTDIKFLSMLIHHSRQFILYYTSCTMMYSWRSLLCMVCKMSHNVTKSVLCLSIQLKEHILHRSKFTVHPCIHTCFLLSLLSCKNSNIF